MSPTPSEAETIGRDTNRPQEDFTRYGPRKRRKVERSRSGCLTCRKRHKLCDRGKPSCAACQRLSLVSFDACCKLYSLDADPKDCAWPAPVETEDARGGSVESTATALSSSHARETTGTASFEPEQTGRSILQPSSTVLDVIPAVTGTPAVDSGAQSTRAESSAEFNLETWLSFDEVSVHSDAPKMSSHDRRLYSSGPPTVWLSPSRSPSRIPSEHSPPFCLWPYLPAPPPPAVVHQRGMSDIINAFRNTIAQLSPPSSRARRPTRPVPLTRSSPWRTLPLRPPRARVYTLLRSLGPADTWPIKVKSSTRQSVRGWRVRPTVSSRRGWANGRPWAASGGARPSA